MSCVPDFARLLWISGIFMFSGIILYVVWLFDRELQACSGECLRKSWLIACITASIVFFVQEPRGNACREIGLLILAVYLTVCSVMDSRLFRVNDFMQYLGMAGGVVRLLHQMPEREIGISLLVFALVQYILFGKMYGSADVMAFLICALYLAADNKDVEYYLYHMAVCYLLVTMVQGVRRNINKKGGLRKPIALYPYISVSFLLIICQ